MDRNAVLDEVLEALQAIEPVRWVTDPLSWRDTPTAILKRIMIDRVRSMKTVSD
jgi:hypothetical protein